jgi:hypothetical protein
MNSIKTALLTALLAILLLLSAERASAWYDPTTQRWLNRDPLGDVASLAILAVPMAQEVGSQNTGEVTEGEFLNGWVEVNRNLYRAVGNDSVNSIDALGESLVGKGVAKICKLGAKGLRKVYKTELGRKEAIDAVKSGEDVIAKNRNAAKEIAKGAGDGKTPIHEIDKKTGGPHYHPHGRSGGHVLYDAAAALTLEHAAQGGTDFEKAIARYVDWINPLTVPQDILDIGKAICGEDE